VASWRLRARGSGSTLPMVTFARPWRFGAITGPRGAVEVVCCQRVGATSFARAATRALSSALAAGVHIHEWASVSQANVASVVGQFCSSKPTSSPFPARHPVLPVEVAGPRSRQERGEAGGIQDDCASRQMTSLEASSAEFQGGCTATRFRRG
jgi:hypothetical protein